MRRARARKEEQRRQHPEARLNRVRSAFTQEVMGFVYRNLGVHRGLPAEESGQLPDLGLTRYSSAWVYTAYEIP